MRCFFNTKVTACNNDSDVHAVNFLYAYFLCAIVLNHTHLVCPFVLAWSNREFRTYMLTRPEKFVLLPMVIVIGCAWVGWGATPYRLVNHGQLLSYSDFPWWNIFDGWWNYGKVPTGAMGLRTLVVVYYVWNIWHFAAQNYGICALRKGSYRERNCAFALTVVCMLGLPLCAGNVLWILIIGEGVSLLHWVGDIAVSTISHRYKWWLFLIIVLALGSIGFIFKALDSNPIYCGALPICTIDGTIPGLNWLFPGLMALGPMLLATRLGLGIDHFLYSRWIWRRGTPFNGSGDGSMMWAAVWNEILTAL